VVVRVTAALQAEEKRVATVRANALARATNARGEISRVVKATEAAKALPPAARERWCGRAQSVDPRTVLANERGSSRATAGAFKFKTGSRCVVGASSSKHLVNLLGRLSEGLQEAANHRFA
jgi:hypothetical protein